MPTLRFNLGRVPIEIELFHFLGAALLGIHQARGPRGLLWLALWIAVVIVSVLVHELGHAAALARLRRPATVTLHGLGGVTSHSSTLTPRQNILVHLAGPLPVLLIVGLPARWWFWEVNASFGSSEFIWRLAYDVYMVNFWWSIINLLPLWPLDGGQIMASATQLRDPRGNWPLVHWVSIVTAVLGGAYALTVTRDHSYVFLFALLLAVQNFMKLRGSRVALLHPGYQDSLALGGAHPPPRRGPRGERAPKPPKAPKLKPAERLARGYLLLAQGNSEGARAEAIAVSEGRVGSEHQAVAGEIIAWSYLQERNVPKARAAIAEVANRSLISPCLFAALDLTGGDEGRAIDAIAAALVDEPEGPAKRQVIDYLGRRELGVRLAERLLALPMGQGFEAAVRVAAVLAETGRREQAAKVQEMVFGL